MIKIINKEKSVENTKNRSYNLGIKKRCRYYQMHKTLIRLRHNMSDMPNKNDQYYQEYHLSGILKYGQNIYIVFS